MTVRNDERGCKAMYALGELAARPPFIVTGEWAGAPGVRAAGARSLGPPAPAKTLDQAPPPRREPPEGSGTAAGGGVGGGACRTRLKAPETHWARSLPRRPLSAP